MALSHGVKFSDQAASTRPMMHSGTDSTGGSSTLRDLTDERSAPANIFEAAEQGAVGWIVKTVERAVEFNINQRDRLSRTALHWAAEMGHVDVIEALVDYGADVKVTECNGRTPLHLAARGCHVDAMHALIEPLTMREMDAAVNATDMLGVTPVFLALQKGVEGQAAFEFLMEHGAQYNTTTSRLKYDPDADLSAEKPTAPGAAAPKPEPKAAAT